MRYITLVLVACLSITACGQSKSQKEEKEQIALVEKYTEKIWSEMKHYEVQPAYYLRLYHINCTFQVLVNGIEVFRNHKLEKLGSAIFLNRFILKSGKQEVTVRMYPLGTLLQEEYGEETYDDILTLLPQSNVEVKVTHIADLKTYESPSKDEKTLLIYNSPVDNQKEFIGKGLPYYEYSFEFDAKVPYEFEGWSNGVDLSTINQEELKYNLLMINKELIQMYLDKKGEKIISLMINRLIRDAETKYLEKEELMMQLKTILNDIYEDKSFYKIEDENLEFVIDFHNKIISQRVTNDLIKSRSLEFTEDRGSSSIIFINNQDIGNALNVYFYMPKEYEGKEVHLEYMP